MTGLPRGVVFDCDGTLADTETVSEASWRVVLARHGYELTPHDVRAVRGHPWPAVWAHYVARVPVLGEVGVTSFRGELADVFARQFDRSARLFDDARDVLEALLASDVAVAVCSSSGRAHLDRVRGLDPLLEQVAAWVGRQDTDDHKPHPAPYLEAARRLELPPTDCVAVEDTPVGATSATAAGMAVVGIDRDQGHARDEWPDGVRLVTRLTTAALASSRS